MTYLYKFLNFLIYKFMTNQIKKKKNRKETYIALCGQVGLHGHGVFDHQLSSDFAEQVQGCDTRHKPGWVDTFILYKGKQEIKITSSAAIK